MTSTKGENVVAPGWFKYSPSIPNANTPDVNDPIGRLNCTPGYNWAAGVPVASPDGGTWQNVYEHEDFAQTVSGLTVGVTYYFKYYYASQGITSFTTPFPPKLTIIGATGYSNPPAGALFEWQTYTGTIVATATSITIIASQGVGSYGYMAFDGFYLSVIPPSDVNILSQPLPVSVCAGLNAGFSIQAVNAISYQWQVNSGTGWIDINDNSLYSATATDHLQITGTTHSMDGYQYRCFVTSTCCNSYSLPATLSVLSPADPSLIVTASGTTICAGTPVVFTASPSNAGSSPTFQWIKNGTSVGNNSNNYTDSNPANGDLVSCTIIADNPCAINSTATSNNIVLTVNSAPLASVIITPSENPVCSGTPVTFTSVTANGGDAPQYAWFKNGVNLSVNAPAYTDNILNSGDVIMCSVISSMSCASQQPVASNLVSMNVNPLQTASVNITASEQQICPGAPVDFTATVINGGTSFSYQWKKNNENVGTNASNYTDNNLALGDIIKCVITVSNRCYSSPTAASNDLTITVLPNPVVSLDHNNTLCQGSSRNLDAGNFSAYLWNDGSTSRTFSATVPGDYYVTVTDNNGCRGSDTARITTMLPLPSNFLPADTSLCSYDKVTLTSLKFYNSYQWNNGTSSSSLTITQPGTYWLQVQDASGCTGTDSIIINPKDCMKGCYVPSAFTPNNDGTNDVFRPMLLGNVTQYHFAIYNRWGQIVFQSSELHKGWDGSLAGKPQQSDVFIWVCTYRFEGADLKTEKGTVMLIR